MRRIIGIAAGVALLGTGFAVATWAYVQWRYDRMVWTDLSAATPRPVALVFGAGIRPDGGLSPMLRDRMDTAIELYRAGLVRKLLVNGDNRLAAYDEPGRMYDYAIAQGVPPEDVVRDYAGRRTYDTCYRASAIFGVTRAILVTQRFHLPRALFTCRSLGIDAAGFSADRRVYFSNPYYRARDALATLRACWDVMIARPTPVLGPKEDMGLSGRKLDAACRSTADYGLQPVSRQ
jgi:SanA protein